MATFEDESYVKALAITNLVYFLLFGAMAAYYEWFFISQPERPCGRPFLVVPPGYVANQFIVCSMPFFGQSPPWGF